MPCQMEIRQTRTRWVVHESEVDKRACHLVRPPPYVMRSSNSGAIFEVTFDPNRLSSSGLHHIGNVVRRRNPPQTQASLKAYLTQRRKIQREAARSARAGGGARTRAASSRGPGACAAAVSSRSFQAMQSRALRLFQRSVSRFQELTEDDFRRVAGLDLVRPKNAEGDASGREEDHGDDLEGTGKVAGTARGTAAGETDPEKRQGEAASGVGTKDPSGHDGDENKDDDSSDAAEDQEEEEEEGSNPTPSLSARSTSSSSSRRRSRPSVEPRPEEGKEGGGQSNDLVSLSSPSSHTISDTEAAAVLRVVRATVLVLGGCGLGALPSDRELWEAVRPMLLDGSFKHRLRHFDRRAWAVLHLGKLPYLPTLTVGFCLQFTWS